MAKKKKNKRGLRFWKNILKLAKEHPYMQEEILKRIKRINE